MSGKSVAQRAHVKPGATIAVINDVPGVVASLGLPDDVVFVEPPAAQLIFVFANTHAELQTLMPTAVRELAPGSALWVFFRKGSKSAGLDMSRNDVWTIAEKMNLRPLGLVGVDETWSAFRLRPAT